MNRGYHIKKNNKLFIFFCTFFLLFSNNVNSITILGALNKVSGKISKIKIEDNSEIFFGTLKIVAFIKIWDRKFEKEEEEIFSGWMFSSSPSISTIDHAVYDVWVIDCMISYIED